MSYYYFQQHGGEEEWLPIPVSMRIEHERTVHPRYYTALSASALVTKESSADDRDKLKYEGPFYLDWDARGDIEFATQQTIKLLETVEAKGVNMAAVAIYATGGKGYHAEIPQACFMAKVQPLPFLPTIYREMALKLAVDSLDLRIYSRGRGRMWRTPNVQRENGAYKVQITWAELKEMTPELYAKLCSAPRAPIHLEKPLQTLGMTVMFDEAHQEIKAKLGAKKKKKVEPLAIRKMTMPSLDAFMAGRGIKTGTGFHPIAMQLAIVADTMGWSEDEILVKAEGLIEMHSGDGDRYNTVDKRSREIQRMHRYMSDNPCYEFSVGALKSMMSHDAPDLDGIPVSAAEVEENIVEGAKRESEPHLNGDDVLASMDAYGDIARGLDLTKYGIYIETEFGKKRICAISFDKVEVMKDITSGLVSSYTADILANGKLHAANQTIELETFSGLQAFNRWASRIGHAMQGGDQHVRALMLRVAQKATVSGKVRFAVKREGLDVINIPGHENTELHKPFLVWADATGVKLEPRAAATGVELTFQGFPDPRGTYRTDLSDAPKLFDWAKTDQKERFRQALHSFFGCQKPEVMSNVIGWYTACFYRMLFNKAYDKFPLLHVTGHAGIGKTELNRTMLAMFYYNQTPKELTPQSSIFAIQQNLAGSSSIPLMVDEYKPHEMNPELHNKLKLLWRDAYNNREITKGGGNRDSDDFRSLNLTQISAPIVFISESMEEEPATMERVVLVSITRSSREGGLLTHAKFQDFQVQKQNLGVIGAYMAATIVHEYSVEQLRAEFDPLYQAAQDKYMLTMADLEGGLPPEVLRVKQGAKQRTVYNFCVAHFGLVKFKELMSMLYGEHEFAAEFVQLEAAVYSKMADLLPATQAEYLKVINTFAAMSYENPDDPGALIKKFHYAKGSVGGKDTIEFAMRACYTRYRIHCKNVSLKPLFTGEPAFMHAMKDSPALMQAKAVTTTITAPGGTFIFDMDELRKLGVDDFRD